MTSETMRYAAIMLAAGIGIPVLAGLNSALGVKLGNPAAAAVCLFAVASLSVLVVFSLPAHTVLATYARPRPTCFWPVFW